MFTYHQLKRQECTLLAYISETGMLELNELIMILKKGENEGPSIMLNQCTCK
jgi:hypothetical protein